MIAVELKCCLTVLDEPVEAILVVCADTFCLHQFYRSEQQDDNVMFYMCMSLKMSPKNDKNGTTPIGNSVCLAQICLISKKGTWMSKTQL